MSSGVNKPAEHSISSFDAFAEAVDYSLMNTLNADPQSTDDGHDHRPRQVFSGHYVPVAPTPIVQPEYVAHSATLFNELGLSNGLAQDSQFAQMFSGDMSSLGASHSQASDSTSTTETATNITANEKPEATLRPYGWATGYALSIYGTEYTQQCPFRTGNGYGDGRAISVFEGVFKGRRWEMQLKGGGPTPYCRGADGRAVLRSSVREFLAQEHMHALQVPTSRSLTLYASHTETVTRPWYSPGGQSYEPDVMVKNPVAISTRVAPSFLRVGQIELFARRVRAHNRTGEQVDFAARAHAIEELRLIVSHVIDREYADQIDRQLPFAEQLITLATAFRDRLTSLVANWMRVGFCQGNFNSDNCALGGYTLDYGPFGFCELFDPEFQPWTGGGHHFSFFNQPMAAQANYHMFWAAIRTLLENMALESTAEKAAALAALDQVREQFATVQQAKLETMWASKLGLAEYDAQLTQQLFELMAQTAVDYTMFFRELSSVPESMAPLETAFYQPASEALSEQWQDWLQRWRNAVLAGNSVAAISASMKQVNPKYTWREWFVVPAYEQAMKGDYSLVRELQAILNNPYDEQSADIESRFYRLKPAAFFNAGGVSHYSCSS